MKVNNNYTHCMNAIVKLIDLYVFCYARDLPFSEPDLSEVSHRITSWRPLCIHVVYRTVLFGPAAASFERSTPGTPGQRACSSTQIDRMTNVWNVWEGEKKTFTLQTNT